MNRPIKFRAWDRDREEMFDDLLGTGYEAKRALMGLELHEYLRMVGGAFEDYVPMQFTGLLDKNGKEIYEGDILTYSVQGDKQTPTYIVENMCDLYARCNDSDSYYRMDESSLEIIGNIYESSDLIEKEV